MGLCPPTFIHRPLPSSNAAGLQHWKIELRLIPRFSAEASQRPACPMPLGPPQEYECSGCMDSEAGGDPRLHFEANVRNHLGEHYKSLVGIMTSEFKPGGPGGGECTHILAACRQDGTGSQMQAKISAWAYAQLKGLRYIHVPLKVLDHFSPHVFGSIVPAVENFFNLGEGEMTLQEAAASNGTLGMKICSVLHCFNFFDQWKAVNTGCWELVKSQLRRKMLGSPKPRSHFRTLAVRRLLARLAGSPLPFATSPWTSSSHSPFNASSASALTPKPDPWRGHGLKGKSKRKQGGLAKSINVAMHLRRGDVELLKATDGDRSRNNSYYLNVLDTLREKLLPYAVEMDIVVLSEGSPEDFEPIVKAYPSTRLVLSTELIESLQTMIVADVLVMAKSSLSYVGAIYNSGLVVYDRYWHAQHPSWMLNDAEDRSVLKRGLDASPATLNLLLNRARHHRDEGEKLEDSVRSRQF